MDVRFINPFIVSCRTVCDMMIHVPITLGKPYLRQYQGPHMSVSAIIGFGGSITGSVVIRLSLPVAIALASGLIGAPIPGLNADGVDALGEIANMIAGHAKKDLPGGLATLSVPSVILGDHKVEHPSGVPVIVIPCETPLGAFLIEVAIQSVAQAAEPLAASVAATTAV